MKQIIQSVVVSLATSLLVSVILFLLLVIPHLEESKKEASKDHVFWTGLEMMSWLGIGIPGVTQSVVEAGVREDGVVVWRERLMNGRTEPAMFSHEKYLYPER